MKKITFIGDIMCEEPLLKASRNGNNYDFSEVFAGCRMLFSQSDFVVGNLETVFAGRTAGYTKELFSFNTPDTFAEAMRKFGIDFVTTATNHALDRDIQGLIRTLDILDQVGIEHIGAYRTKDERNEIYTRTFDDVKVAFLNYTYGTNTYESPYYIADSEWYRLNLLMPQKYIIASKQRGIRSSTARALRKVVSERNILRVKKKLGRSYTNEYTDVLEESSVEELYLKRVRDDICKARKLAEIIIVCLHIGGQFNRDPGTLVTHFVKQIQEAGADYIINTHAHVVQKAEQIGNTFVAHCLGNFSISPSSVYVPHELKPEYSIALHLYLDGGRVAKKSFSVLKIIEDKGHKITVKPVDEITAELTENEKDSMKKDVSFICMRFAGSSDDDFEIKREYPL